MSTAPVGSHFGLLSLAALVTVIAACGGSSQAPTATSAELATCPTAVASSTQPVQMVVAYAAASLDAPTAATPESVIGATRSK